MANFVNESSVCSLDYSASAELVAEILDERFACDVVEFNFRLATSKRQLHPIIRIVLRFYLADDPDQYIIYRGDSDVYEDTFVELIRFASMDRVETNTRDEAMLREMIDTFDDSKFEVKISMK